MGLTIRTSSGKSGLNRDYFGKIMAKLDVVGQGRQNAVYKAEGFSDLVLINQFLAKCKPESVYKVTYIRSR